MALLRKKKPVPAQEPERIMVRGKVLDAFCEAVTEAVRAQFKDTSIGPGDTFYIDLKGNLLYPVLKRISKCTCD